VRFAGAWSDIYGAFMRRKLAAFSLFAFLAIVLVAIFAGQITSIDPTKQNLMQNLKPPLWMEGGSSDHLLGTDHFGRDIFARVIYGARVSLVVASMAALFSLIVGTFIGVVAGYAGGRTDNFLMRFVDVFLAFPLILLALSLASILGPSLQNLILVMGLTGWMVYARTIRSAVMNLREREFVLAARSLGTPPTRIVLRHILPNVIAPAVVLFTFGFAQFIIMESALSYLGLGVPPPTPTWGRMLNEGRDYLTTAWWITTFPGIAIMLTTLVLNFIGDGLRDAMDPRLRKIL